MKWSILIILSFRKIFLREIFTYFRGGPDSTTRVPAVHLRVCRRIKNVKLHRILLLCDAVTERTKQFHHELKEEAKKNTVINKIRENNNIIIVQ